MSNRRLLRRPEIEAHTGRARSTLYRAMAKGTLPRPVRAGPSCFHPSRVENDSANPRASAVVRIAAAVGVTIAALVTPQAAEGRLLVGQVGESWLLHPPPGLRDRQGTGGAR